MWAMYGGAWTEKGPDLTAEQPQRRFGVKGMWGCGRFEALA
jgi:hypothetical protein